MTDAKWLAPGTQGGRVEGSPTVTAQSAPRAASPAEDHQNWLSSLLLHRSSVASSTASPSWKMALMLS